VAAGWQITTREQPEGLGRVTDLLRRAAAAAPWEATRSMEGCARSASPTTRWVPCGRAADLLHELRGDSHVISWAVGGADAVEIMLLRTVGASGA